LGYVVSDGQAEAAEATITLDVTPLADTPQLAFAAAATQGLEDTRIALPSISAGLADADGSETLVLTLMGLPVGTVVQDATSNGSRSFTVSDAARVVNLTGWNTAALVLQPPANYSGTLNVQVQATSIETATGGRATVTKQLQVQVAAVADAPVLNMTARNVSLSRELLSTSWESVTNRNRNFTLVAGKPGSTLEGWSVLQSDTGKQTAFEIWSAGDQMRNTAGQLVTVQAPAGGSRNWLQLNNAAGQGHQTLGIYRGIQTIESAVYSLSFDYAGALGLPDANTRVGIYVDGQQVGSYADTSSLTALNWRALNFQFSGNGGVRELLIRIEGGNTANNGRGAMVDNIRIVETLPAGNNQVYGLVGTAIALPIINASLRDTDGSESLKVELLGLPAGATLSDGTRSITLPSGGAINLTGWNLATLSLVPPSGFVGELSLQVRATSTEASNGATASVTQALTVRVLSGVIANTPLTVSPYVTFTSGGGSTTSSSGTGTTPTQIVVGPMVSDSGLLTISLAPALWPRTWEEEEAADQDPAGTLSDEWLQELEQFARDNWQSLVG
jgi:hypothetical protein